MKTVITALALSLFAAGSFAAASAPAAAAPAAVAASKAPTAKQNKMGECAKANKGKKGQEYKDGVKACLAA